MTAPPTDDDARWMAAALALGSRHLGRTWPNPAVGCVLVRDGVVVGRGATAPGGRPHAEKRALAQAGATARGATAYVTLEPCAHRGATPPCTEALLRAGITRVVTAMTDPDPRTAGQGHRRLRAAGIEVVTGLAEAAARGAHEGFLTRLALGRPSVTLKLAASLDGRIATASGESRWITGAAARRWVHLMRLTHDAVLVGGGTARTDDPALDVRGFGNVAPPVRIVASRRADLPVGGRLAGTMRAAPLWLVHGTDDVAAGAAKEWEGRGARLFPVAVDAGGHLDPAATLAALGAAGLTRVLCEGGGTLAAALLAAGLVDRLVLFTAGAALGAEGRPALGALGVGPLAAAPRLTLTATEAIGGDVMTVWRRTSSPDPT